MYMYHTYNIVPGTECWENNTTTTTTMYVWRLIEALEPFEMKKMNRKPPPPECNTS